LKCNIAAKRDLWRWRASIVEYLMRQRWRRRDLDVPGFRLHALKGEGRGRWSIWVNGNWRVTFEFRDAQAYVLDYEDYH
jgi:toxin HigB-1